MRVERACPTWGGKMLGDDTKRPAGRRTLKLIPGLVAWLSRYRTERALSDDGGGRSTAWSALPR